MDLLGFHRRELVDGGVGLMEEAAFSTMQTILDELDRQARAWRRLRLSSPGWRATMSP